MWAPALKRIVVVCSLCLQCISHLCITCMKNQPNPKINPKIWVGAAPNWYQSVSKGPQSVSEQGSLSTQYEKVMVYPPTISSELVQQHKLQILSFLNPFPTAEEPKVAISSSYPPALVRGLSYDTLSIKSVNMGPHWIGPSVGFNLTASLLTSL